MHNNQRFLFSSTFLSVLCFIQRLFSVCHLFSAHVSLFFCKDSLKIHFDFDRHQFYLQLLQTCVDSCLICTSTAVTLRLHGCGGSFRPTYAHHVTVFHAFNHTLLAPVTGPFFDVLGRSFAVNGTDAPTLLGVSVGIFSFYFLFYELSLNTSLRVFLASPTAATFQHGILTQLACKESTVILLRSLQYGSKFGLRPLFVYQDQTHGRVLVQLYSGNIVFLGPPSLEEYQMHRVQRFNIQSRIYTFVNYTLQFSSEPVRPLSMSLPMTNVSTHRFDYIACIALYSEVSSQQRSYFSVLEQVAQASRLRQQLRLFLQDEDNLSITP